MSDQRDGDNHCDELLQKPNDVCTISVVVPRKVSVKEKVTSWFHSKAFQLSVVVLCCLDGIIVICVLLLEIEVLKLKSGQLRSQLISAQFLLECSSIIIVSLFILEIPLKLGLFGYKFFCNHWLELIDAFVCIVSFAVDVYNIARHVQHGKGVMSTLNQADAPYETATSHEQSTGFSQRHDGSSSKNTLADAAGLLVLFRLWRVVRIVNGWLPVKRNPGRICRMALQGIRKGNDMRRMMKMKQH
ncbi:unnamed protein product [Dicrocoelium dendriticum]|nr:unnamed protein product [Dicrocoelium dendriticum]